MNKKLSHGVVLQPRRDEGDPRKARPRVTLAPLVAKGRDCLFCGDVEGALSVTLRVVTLYYDGIPWQRITRESDDIFELVENGLFSWTAVDQILCATFLVQLKDGSSWCVPLQAGFVMKCPGEEFGWDRQDEWLEKRGFLIGGIHG